MASNYTGFLKCIVTSLASLAIDSRMMHARAADPYPTT